MTTLSLAAQNVLQTYCDHWSSEKLVLDKPALIAALRAAADQGLSRYKPINEWGTGFIGGVECMRQSIYGIADELENE
jgi:hypothetical protein